MTNDTRRRLISLLDQYPLARESYLHDGRRTVAPREDFADKIEALFAPESGASITTPEGQRDYYRDLMAEVSDENTRLSRDLAEYEAYESLPSLFQQVMQASPNYVTRFKGTVQFHGAASKMQEEYLEFQHAVGDYAAAMTDDTPLSLRLKSPHQLRKEAAREMIDLFVTAAGLAASIGLTWEDIEQSARETLLKLDSRTTDTHAWSEDTQTVERIGKEVKP